MPPALQALLDRPSPVVLSLSDFPPPAPPATPLDPVLAGMVGRGLGQEAICLYLGWDRETLDDRLVALDLPTPPDRPLRRPGGRNPWTVGDIHQLIPWWLDNLHVESIGERLGRTAGAVRAKARRLGLPRRDRKALFRQPWHPPTVVPVEAPVEAPPPPPPLPDAIVIPFPLPKAAPKRVEKPWLAADDEELARRSWANQHWKAIARDMGRSLAAVRSRQTRLQLPSHDRTLLVDHFDPSVVEANIRAAGYVKRTCQILKRAFWAHRNGDRFYCREAKKTRAYRDRHGGADELYLA